MSTVKDRHCALQSISIVSRHQRTRETQRKPSVPKSASEERILKICNLNNNGEILIVLHSIKYPWECDVRMKFLRATTRGQNRLKLASSHVADDYIQITLSRAAIRTKYSKLARLEHFLYCNPIDYKISFHHYR